MRFFNTAGPVTCEDHYCLPPLERFDLNEIISLIKQKKYFVLHAPRQTGKTSCLLALMAHLNATREYRALYFNVESAQGAREDVFRGIRAILSEMADRADAHLHDESLQEIWTDVFQRSGADAALNAVITRWCKSSSTPAVLLIDEIDSLVGDTLISVLRQLRAGYDKRPVLFPQSAILCGVRDVRDYRIHSARENAIITGGSAFNVKAKSLRLGDFNENEIEVLYKEHTDETGQEFEPEALELVWRLTQGQPWLVNALGYEVCFEMKGGRERTRPIKAKMIEQAKENIILRRDTHIDQLADKLQEERVRRVIEPILAGAQRPERIPVDDISYVHDLGLIRTEGQLRIANRIYDEIIPRELTYSTQLTIGHEPAWYIRPEEGLLDVDKLLSAFQEFFREHSEHWVERFDYKEAGPQLLMQAFLQRIVNRGGRVEREYGLGRMRTDLLVIWPYHELIQKVVIELKVLHKSLARTVAEGLEQTLAYMERCATDDGHLVIFDRDPKKSWDDKIFVEKKVFQNKKITIWGM
jgi:hypothetical protein